MRAVAALCVDEGSVFKSLAGVECYDVKRDARTFGFDMPVVAMPPCADYSRMRGFAKHVEGRKELGPFCIDAVRRCGGVLEQPASSRLFDGLPPPGGKDQFGFTVVVDQSWFGFPARKRTFLYFCGLSDFPAVPLSLCYPAKLVEYMDKRARSKMTVQLAEWLVAYARVTIPSPLMAREAL